VAIEFSNSRRRMRGGYHSLRLWRSPPWPGRETGAGLFRSTMKHQPHLSAMPPIFVDSGVANTKRRPVEKNAL
jgi:hypothetical protein